MVTRPNFRAHTVWKKKYSLDRRSTLKARKQCFKHDR